MAIRSLAEWRLLPEIACPVIEGEAREGSIYTLHKVGFLALSAADCKDADLSGVVFECWKYLFPTAEVDFVHEKHLCRLPLQLSDWVIDTMALVHQRQKSPFPKRVEFGILRGRHYAEML
jgi:hypothetical protein